MDTVVTVIRPPSRWPGLRLRELVQRRELLAFLVWRDLLVRYKQAALGVLWALLQPLASMAIFAVVFGRLAGLPSDGLPYTVFVLTGLVLWGFFSSALVGAAGSLTGSAQLLTKVWFPRLLVPVAAVFAALPDMAISLPILAALMAWHGIGPGAAPAGLIVLPLLLALLVLLAAGAGAGLAALNVRYRDVRHALPFLVQLWMFATPIVWPLSLATPGLRRIAMLNPLCGIVEGARAAATGRPLPMDAIGASVVTTLAIAAAGLAYFQNVERSFADEV